MGPTIIARNYAETLLALAQQHGGDPTVDAFAESLDQVVDLLREEPRVREFLETPRVDAESKKQALRATFGGRVPEYFLRFLLIVVEKRRQALLPQIGDEYRALVDTLRNRVRARITLSTPASPELEREIVTTLERKLGRTVVARFETDPDLIAGVVIRVGDQILDGSLERRLAALRRRLLEAPLARPAALNSTQG